MAPIQVFDMPMDSHVIDTIREDLKTDAFAQAILAQIEPMLFRSALDYRVPCIHVECRVPGKI